MNATFSSCLIHMAIRSATIAIAIAMEIAGMLEQTNKRTNDKQTKTSNRKSWKMRKSENQVGTCNKNRKRNIHAGKQKQKRKQSEQEVHEKKAHKHKHTHTY